MTTLDIVALMILWGGGIILLAAWCVFLSRQYDRGNHGAVLWFGGFPVAFTILWAIYWVIWRL